MLLLVPRRSYRHPAPRELAEASVVYYNWQYLIAKIQRSGETTKKKERKNGLVKKMARKDAALVRMISLLSWAKASTCKS